MRLIVLLRFSVPTGFIVSFTTVLSRTLWLDLVYYFMDTIWLKRKLKSFDFFVLRSLLLLLKNKKRFCSAIEIEDKLNDLLIHNVEKFHCKLFYDQDLTANPLKWIWMKFKSISTPTHFIRVLYTVKWLHNNFTSEFEKAFL